MDAVEKIVAAVLYEGYLLWPYRRSARKNQHRWTFGGVYPQRHSEVHPDDPWLMQTQCLVTGARSRITVKVRFLHVVDRQVGRTQQKGGLEFVDELVIGDDRYLAWDEATEREILIEDLGLPALQTPQIIEINIPAGSAEEPLFAAGGAHAGALVRSWQALAGAVEVHAQQLQDDLFRLTVRIINTTPWHGQDRETTLRQTLVSTHTILTVTRGEFISLMDPPASLKSAAEACMNLHTWPVLAGEVGDTHTLLSSPIILYDYPQIAPESSGDLFDGCEIDQLLMLNILTLTDREKDEMRATDPRARQILQRSETLTGDDFMKLHGAIREFRRLDQDPEVPAWFTELERPVLQNVEIDGVHIGQGSRVRLHPRPGGDILDLALAGKVALVERVEQDSDNQVHLAVVIEDDPGHDLGLARMPGHRFFFSPDEVEPLEA